MFGCDNNIKTDLVLDLLILFAKSYIYRCKTNNNLPNFSSFLEILRRRYEIEKYIAIVKMKYNKHVRIWQNYQPLLN